nr:DUF6444 domain-containing protein [Candidatus Cardinium hertigii]
MELNIEIIPYLLSQVQILEAKIALLESENKALRLENAHLKEKLGLNAKNSSIPSSKELYKSKKRPSHKSGRKPGGQPGHTGATRSKMVADSIVTNISPIGCYIFGCFILNKK